MADYDIEDWEDAADVSIDLAGNYTVLNDLLATTAGYATYAGPSANGGLGWDPIGAKFIGSFDGNGFIIDGLTINRPTEDEVGFIKVAGPSTISNALFTNVDITGKRQVGLVGTAFTGTVINFSNIKITGSIHGVGEGTACSTGGFAGLQWGATVNINQCCTDLQVTGGVNTYDIGGFIGRSFTSGGVTTITNSYAKGIVSGTGRIGGLCGLNGSGAQIHTVNSYSASVVSGTTGTGGLIGQGPLTSETSTYWDTEVSGQATASGGVGTGKTTAEMQTESTFTGWDFATVWVMDDYPELQWAAGPCSPAIVSYKSFTSSFVSSFLTSLVR